MRRSAWGGCWRPTCRQGCHWPSSPRNDPTTRMDPLNAVILANGTDHAAPLFVSRLSMGVGNGTRRDPPRETVAQHPGCGPQALQSARVRMTAVVPAAPSFHASLVASAFKRLCGAYCPAQLTSARHFKVPRGPATTPAHLYYGWRSGSGFIALPACLRADRAYSARETLRSACAIPPSGRCPRVAAIWSAVGGMVSSAAASHTRNTTRHPCRRLLQQSHACTDVQTRTRSCRHFNVSTGSDGASMPCLRTTRCVTTCCSRRSFEVLHACHSRAIAVYIRALVVHANAL